jgi:hypothetical protein
VLGGVKGMRHDSGVKRIRDTAERLRLYAKQSKDKIMLADSTAIIERAVRRLGEIIEEQKKTVVVPNGHEHVLGPARAL